MGVLTVEQCRVLADEIHRHGHPRGCEKGKKQSFFGSFSVFKVFVSFHRGFTGLKRWPKEFGLIRATECVRMTAKMIACGRMY